LFAAPSVAGAQVYFYDVFYNGFFFQADENPPISSQHYEFNARMTHADAGDFDAASITIRGGSSFPLTFESDTTAIYRSVGYSNPEDMRADYPVGTYEHSISGGVLGDQTATLERCCEWWPPEPPMFTGDTFTNMQVIDASQEFYVSYNSYDLVDPANLALTFVAVFDYAAGTVPFNEYFDQPATGAVIPANTLERGKTYYFALYHSSRQEYAGAGIGGGTSIAAFDLITFAQAFTSGGGPPCPADFNQDGGIDGGDVGTFFVAWENGGC